MEKRAKQILERKLREHRTTLEKGGSRLKAH